MVVLSAEFESESVYGISICMSFGQYTICFLIFIELKNKPGHVDIRSGHTL